MPSNGQHASLYMWHARSIRSEWRRTVIVKDKRTHLRGFATNHHLFVWTKPRRGARATVASDLVMASFQGWQGHREKDGTLPKQHNAHISKQKPPYGEQNISDALNVFGGGIPSRERLETEMAPCQTQTARRSRAQSKDTLKCTKCRGKKRITTRTTNVAVVGVSEKNYFCDANSAQCQLLH